MVGMRCHLSFCGGLLGHVCLPAPREQLALNETALLKNNFRPLGAFSLPACGGQPHQATDWRFHPR
eukprot:scaffold69855_cov27-Tisochrysis_lutea.AAC.4